MDASATRSLLQNFPVRSLSPDEVLFQQEDEADAAFYVLSGQLTVSSSTAAGHEIEFPAARPGDFLGLELLCRRQFQCTVCCVRRARVCVIPRRDLLALLSDHPKVAATLLGETMNALCVARERLVDVCGRTAIQRLVHHLLCEAGANGASVPLPWGTRARIARKLGIKQETLSRLLHDLRHRELVRVERNQLEILDREQLREIAN